MSDPVAEALGESDASTRAIFGTTDAVEIRRRVDAFCAGRLGSRALRYFHCAVSVGAAFGVELTDGRRVLVKAHPLERSSAFLQAAHRVQAHVSAQGFPAPRPLAEPGPLPPGLATAEEWVDDGAPADAHRPEIRRALAAALARLIELGEPFRGEAALAEGFSILRGARLPPAPHSPIFDFDATSAGAEWIDALAAEARARLLTSPGRLVVGHGDWSIKHFRFEGADVRVVYDWDSVTLAPEAFLVGTAAAHFTSEPPDWRAPACEESVAFVAEYEDARRKPFTAAERAAVQAAIVFGTAYTSRCEHALDPGGAPPPHSFRAALAALTDSEQAPGTLSRP